MKTVLLDGSQENDTALTRITQTLKQVLTNRGHEVEHILLRDKKIGNCAGDFFCWIRSPGICNVDDDNREIAGSIARCELLIYLTPVTFGGYSSTLKSMVDHQIQNISPYFTKLNNETHHRERYDRYPDFLVIGYLDQADSRAESVFRHLAWRNSLNFYAKNALAGILHGEQSEAEISRSIEGWLDEMAGGARLPECSLPETPAQPPEDLTPPEKALLLVGSPRTKKSTSYSLGHFVFEHLEKRGIQTETIHIHTCLRSAERTKALLEAVNAADLVLLAFPLYVDSLPAPVIATLEKIFVHRQGQQNSRRQAFAAIANSGFPEAHHNNTALAICETFALNTGFALAGSMALGAGEGMVHGIPLNEAGGKVRSIRKSLSLAAGALAEGKPIPRQAIKILARPIIPGWLYRLVGGMGWKSQARQYGAQDMLDRRSYALTQP